MLIVKGSAIAQDLADLGIGPEALAAAAKIKLELLRQHLDGAHVLSEAAQREIVLAVHSMATLRLLNPSLDLSSPARTSEVLDSLYRGHLGGYKRSPDEWRRTRLAIEEAGEATQ